MTPTRKKILTLKSDDIVKLKYRKHYIIGRVLYAADNSTWLRIDWTHKMSLKINLITELTPAFKHNLPSTQYLIETYHWEKTSWKLIHFDKIINKLEK